MKIKIKTLKSSKKRFKINKLGLIKYKNSNTRHLLTKKSNKRKRHLRKISIVKKVNLKKIYQLNPYK